MYYPLLPAGHRWKCWDVREPLPLQRLQYKNRRQIQQEAQERKTNIAPVTSISTDDCRLSKLWTPLLLRNRESAYISGQWHKIHVVTMMLFSAVHTTLMETLARFNPFLSLWCSGIHSKGKKKNTNLMKEESNYTGFKNTQDDFFPFIAVADLKNKGKSASLKRKHWIGCWLDSADEERYKCRADLHNLSCMSSLKRKGIRRILPQFCLSTCC